MKPDQERVRNLLMDTVGLLCRNGLSYRDTLKVEGLLGITLDNNEVFLVPIKQCFGEEPTVDPEPQSAEEEVPDPQPPPLKQAKVEPTTEEDTTSSEKKNVSIKAEKSDVQSSNDVNIKSEPADEDDDDDDLVITEAHVVERTPSLGKRKFRHLSSSNSLPRVPPLHGTPPPGAFPQLLKQFLDNSQNGSSGSDGGLGGGSPSMQWMTGETSGGMPNWRPEDTSGGNMDEQMAWAMLNNIGSRRPRSGPKSFVCAVEGCNRSFYYRHDLRRHERLNHQRPVGSRLMPGSMAGCSPDPHSFDSQGSDFAS